MLRTSIDLMKENGFTQSKARSRRYPAQTITGADYHDDIALLANTPARAESLQHSLERATSGIGFHVNAHKTEFMFFNQRGNFSTLNEESHKQIDNVPQKQRLIYWKWHQHATSENMDSYL